MKLSRLLAYGALGIISGLLIENSSLIARRNVRKKLGALKNKMKARHQS